MPKGVWYHLLGKLVAVNSQRVNYKPYGYTLDFSEPKAVYVDVTIPTKSVIRETDDMVEINLDGLKALLSKCADAIDELDKAYLKEVGYK